ncbi:hypothetical protein PCASD_23089 [Puccinia coronata f. sp. avenae]|uniref:Retrotransposon gag domain-containing protein n=1 Tax=Puccinia coronata f. sp. avenae TaxID=200324 RepID=A0A2N5TPS1_9BASI|nr:hypothetical protein PCASD_23089 [Puccinia coronata f. sp. avenae]
MADFNRVTNEQTEDLEDNPPQPTEQRTDRMEMDIMRDDIRSMQRAFDRLMDMMTVITENQPSPDHQHFHHPPHPPPLPHFHPPPPPPPPPPPHNNPPPLHHSITTPLAILNPRPTPEPSKLKDVWFSGDSANLLSFLRVIRDFLRQNHIFQSETRRVVWISRHFGYHPSEHRRTPSPVENWYNSLVIDNARRQGVFDMYADLDGQQFVLPTLATVSAFLDGLIAVFGDKFMRENAKRALAACKQGKLTIGEYNSHFKSLVYLVEDVEATRIERYVSGLNPRIVRKAMCKSWMDCASLDEKMELASDAAAQLDVLAQLPPDSAHPGPHHPLSSQRQIAQAPAQHRPLRDPDAMEIDATRVTPANSQYRSLLDASRALCRARQLCFRCLAPIVPGSHTGSLNCPNTPVSPEKREAFVTRCRSTPATAQVLTISSSTNVQDHPTPLTYHPDPNTLVSVLAPDTAVLDSPPSLGFEEIHEYDELDCAIVDVPIATVHVRLDHSTNNRFLVPASLKSADGSLTPATILVDTGAMANFINSEFVRRHDLTLCQRKVPIRCVGFDGREGVGGVVTEDWAGKIQLSTVNSKPFSLNGSFGVTRLGSVDAIFGLPWLDQQGWIASGTLDGGHQFTLGSNPLYVIESSSMGGKPEDKLFASPP